MDLIQYFYVAKDCSWTFPRVYYFILYSVILCLNIYCTLGGMKVPWVESILMRPEFMVDRLGDETLLLGITRQKL